MTSPERSLHPTSGDDRGALLAAQYPEVNWLGVVTRLWTEDQDLAAYRQKFNVQHPSTIDNTNAVFLAYDVQDIPTLILLDKGYEVFRTRQIDAGKLSTQLWQLSSAK